MHWVWRGSLVHNVTVSSGPRRFHSKDQSSGEFARTLRKRGVYKLVCTIHGFRHADHGPQAVVGAAGRTLCGVDLEGEIDRLYGLPLDEFVAQRAELAKQLRADGERAAADEVKGLRKPTLGAWAINQATRRRTHERDELLAAGERLRAAHEALLSGGDAAALRDATRDERALVSALAETAAAIATEGGKGGAALLERLRSTLHAAAVDEEAARGARGRTGGARARGVRPRHARRGGAARPWVAAPWRAERAEAGRLRAVDAAAHRVRAVGGRSSGAAAPEPPMEREAVRPNGGRGRRSASWPSCSPRRRASWPRRAPSSPRPSRPRRRRPSDSRRRARRWSRRATPRPRRAASRASARRTAGDGASARAEARGCAPKAPAD